MWVQLLNPENQTTDSPFLSPYNGYSISGEKLLKYKKNSSRKIMSYVLMTSLLVLQEKFDAGHYWVKSQWVELVVSRFP